MLDSKQQEEKDRQSVDEIYRFAKVIDRCFELNSKVQSKLLRLNRITPFSKVKQHVAQQIDQNPKSTHLQAHQVKRLEKLN